MSEGIVGGGFDLSTTSDVAAREDDGKWVAIRDSQGEFLTYTPAEGGEKKPVRIRVAGTYSNVYRRATDKQRDRMLRHRRAKLTGAQLNEQQLELVADCVLEWEGFFSGGKPVQCTKLNVVAVLQRAPWIREDVESEMSDHESFFPSAE